MARTTGPLFSQAASGTVGNLITHSNWKGHSYVKLKSKPANPNTPTQISVRAMMAWLNSQWSGFPIDAASRATWEDLAADAGITTLNAYLRHNLQAWSAATPPTQRNPRDPTDALPTITPIGIAVAPNPKFLDYSWITGALNEGWGYMIWRNLGADFTPTRDNLVAIVPLGPAGTNHFLDGPLAPGVWHYRFRRLTKKGRTPAGSTHEFQTVP